ncbi:MAG: hypothetical protein JWP87_2099 [Labilithrix sp.]|nr:hypothetical protein [Labilithrix sp.]
MNRLARLVVASSFLALVACGGTTSTVDGTDVPGSDPGASSGGTGTGSEEPGTSPGTSPGARVTLALRGSTTPVPHSDAFSSQTPASQNVAVKSLWLLKTADDPNPLKVADLGTNAIETDLVSGKTNDIATVSLKSLPAGTYTIAKVGVAWVRYRIAARLHDGVAVDGRYDNVEALSDNVVFDGKPRAKGWFRSEFGVGDTTYGTYESNDAPLPQLASSGGMTLETKGADSFYVFPMHVTIDPNETKDQRLVCEVNVHESFRWQDQPQADYASKVFDTTTTAYEPVMSFGASAFSLFLELK